MFGQYDVKQHQIDIILTLCSPWEIIYLNKAQMDG